MSAVRIGIIGGPDLVSARALGVGSALKLRDRQRASLPGVGD